MKLPLSPHLWSLRLRMIILSLGAILAACLLLGAIAANALYSISLSVGKREAQLTAYQLASEVGQKLNFGMVAMRTLADFHSAIQPGSEISLSRNASTHMLGKILEREPMFVGVYSIWEKNQFDLLDDQFAGQPGHEPNGRHLISWVRDDNGKPLLEEVTEPDYDIPGQGDYYLIPKQKRAPHLMEPYLYPVLGKQVLMTSVLAPILSNGQFRGIFGADILLDYLQDYLDSALANSPGFSFWIITSENQIAAASAQPELQAKPIADVRPELTPHLQSLSSQNATTAHLADKFAVFYPIQVTGIQKPWTLLVEVQNSHLLRTARQTLLQLALAGIAIAIAFSLLVLWFANRISKTLLHISDSIVEISSTLHNSGNHLASASKELSNGASEQASALQQTGASMEQISSMAAVNSDHAAQTREIAAVARKAAEDGALNVEKLQTSMSELQASAQNIRKIIKTIDEIAFQTNLLALNAAVEAARAGEHGQGFAVVADEVRQLAQRSAQASRETADLITESIRRSQAGIESSQKVGESFSQILTQVRQVGNFTSQIADATREQSSGVQHIARALHRLDHVTQTNAQAASETAAASEELLKISIELQNQVQDLLLLAFGAKALQSPQLKNKNN